MGLVLSRKNGERVRIGRHVMVTVVDPRAGRCKLLIDAPRELPVVRGELPLIGDGQQLHGDGDRDPQAAPLVLPVGQLLPCGLLMLETAPGEAEEHYARDVQLEHLLELTDGLGIPRDAACEALAACMGVGAIQYARYSQVLFLTLRLQRFLADGGKVAIDAQLA